MPILTEDSACPCCGSGMDRFMDHALVCPCGGDRTLRHNALRDLVFKEAQLASLRPEKEKPGLLPARPDDETIQGERTLSGRRPADGWLPAWQGSACALDFAATSGMQATMLHASRTDGSAALVAYESKKRSYKDTGELCRAAGFQFVPMVVESHGGGWCTGATKLWKTMASNIADKTGRQHAQTIAVLQQRLNVTHQRENARSVLRRLVPSGVALRSACSDAWLQADDL